MKRLLYCIVLVALFTMGVNRAFAQEGFVSLGWQLGQTTGDTKDFIDERSYEGFNFSAERFVLWGFALGFEVNYSHFYQELGKQTFESDKATYTGSSYKYFDAAPVLLTGRIYLGARNPRSIFVPYFGAGAGLYYVRERLEVGSVAFEDNGWAYGYVPHAGLMIRLDSQAWLFGDVGYNKVFERHSINDHTWYSGTVGIKISF